jgi:hypothetical protein
MTASTVGEDIVPRLTHTSESAPANTVGSHVSGQRCRAHDPLPKGRQQSLLIKRQRPVGIGQHRGYSARADQVSNPTRRSHSGWTLLHNADEHGIASAAAANLVS